MQMKHVGVDIGSTTVKVVVLDEQYHILYKYYARHYSKVRTEALQVIKKSVPFCKTSLLR